MLPFTPSNQEMDPAYCTAPGSHMGLVKKYKANIIYTAAQSVCSPHVTHDSKNYKVTTLQTM